MQKNITLFIIFTFFKGFTQCPAPSNLTVSVTSLTTAELSWTENGTANTWETTVVPDFIVGTSLPTGGFIVTTSNPNIFNDLPSLSGCNVFFVRSVCSATDFSPWVAVGTLGCDANIYSYLATLSNDSFSIINNIKIFPNPTDNILFIDTIEKQIQKIEIFDLQGRLLKTINENKDKYQIDVSNFSSTTYLIKLSTETGSQTVKIVKK